MMILDTNVFSAFTRLKPDRSVVSWLDRQDPEQVWTTAITIYEVRVGIDLLPPGRKRQVLEETFHTAVHQRLAARVLPFDLSAAEAAGALDARRRKEGRPIDIRDTQVAGIVLSRDARLATRNVRHFEDLGIALVNPWVEA